MESEGKVNQLWPYKRQARFCMWLHEEGKASITSANPGILPAVVAKLAGIAYHALTADKKGYWEDKSRVALMAYKQRRAFDQNSSKDEIEKNSKEGGEIHNPEDQSVKTAKRLRVKKKPLKEVNSEKREARQRAHQEAVADFKAGKFKNLNQAAKAHGVSHSTVYRGMKEVWEGNREEENFPGSGKLLTRFTAEEEKKICDVIVWSAKIGY